MGDLTYVCADTWGRLRDGSLWIDVPARMTALGLDLDTLEERKRFARRALRDLRMLGIEEGLIVARIDGIRHR